MPLRPRREYAAVIAERRGLPVSTVAREQILQLLAADAEDPEMSTAMTRLGQLLLAAEKVKEYADDVRHELSPEGILRVYRSGKLRSSI